MTITIEIPADLARHLIADGCDPARQVLESIAIEAYRAHRLTGVQLRRLLGLSSRYELDGFLKERGVWLEYTVDDFRREGDERGVWTSPSGARVAWFKDPDGNTLSLTQY